MGFQRRVDALALERHLKRMAVQLAAQLPDEEAEAMAVLDYIRELLTGYMRPAEERRVSPNRPWAGQSENLRPIEGGKSLTKASD